MGPYIAILCFIIGGAIASFAFYGLWNSRDIYRKKKKS
jgi:hypothetical protein